MKATHFIQEDFLLQNKFAKKLYHDYAEGLPIIDYHNHLSPTHIAADYSFPDLTTAWLSGDHYKWRAMRTLGIEEKYITGNATPVEKFSKWAEAVPFTIRNPLYHWTQLELKRYFDIDESLNPQSAARIYEHSTRLLGQPSHSTLGLLSQMKVEVLCTTDDPVDSLEAHLRANTAGNTFKILPTFRPDKAYAVDDPVAYLSYLKTLEEVSGCPISNFSDLLSTLENRINYFHSHGCRLADHGLEYLPFPEQEGGDPDRIFRKLQRKKVLEPQEIISYRFQLLQALCKDYHRRGWVQQFHLGALRNTNSRMQHSLGADTGFDSIGDFRQARSLSAFLDCLDRENRLPKTILYNLNPSDNEVMATMSGNFNDGSVKGKVQWGAAWWYLDQKDGMERHLNTLSNMGLLSCFVGMLTDSRSFLSFPRHEYFRRILCNLLGQDVETGQLPSDESWLGKLVQDICYHNAREYFPFE